MIKKNKLQDTDGGGWGGPTRSLWTVNIGGGAVVYTPYFGKVPNWFHRKMQELILGFKWTKKA